MATGCLPEFHKYGLAVREEGSDEHYWLLLLVHLLNLQEQHLQ
jgi:hypothetical protein